MTSAIRISKEIVNAVKRKKPVVALESTIITHGLPYPQNLEMARTVEAIIREQGAIPATIGFVRGEPIVGLNDIDLEFLARTRDPSTPNESPEKISRRDIPHVMARKLSGGTTIAGTMILAHHSKIKVFSTGGLGGIHRGVETTWDVSADLDELARTPVGVVCSGPKSILDIPKTIEYLETKGVHVSTLGQPGTNIPGFYTKDSGVPSPFNFQTPEDAAKILHYVDKLNLNTGSVFCVPAPDYCALPNSLIDVVIDRAIEEANHNHTFGKNLTPFLLQKVWEATNGKSVDVNIEFVKNNARIGAQIAKELANLEGSMSVFMAKDTKPTDNVPLTDVTPIESHPPKALVFGSLAQDFSCSLNNYQGLSTSYKGSISTTVGGVAHNIVKAANYVLPGSTRLVSIVGTDFNKIHHQHLDVSGLETHPTQETAKYVALYKRSGGDLIAACADMDIIHQMTTKHMLQQIDTVKPAVVFFDGNLSTEQKQALLDHTKTVKPIVGFEPTSVPKAQDLAVLDLGVYPDHSIDVAVPNLAELEAMVMAFQSNAEKFDTDSWFPVIDAFGINEPFRNRLTALASKNTAIRPFEKAGAIQQAIRLLPYIPTLIIKDGPNGVLVVKLVDTLTNSPTANTLVSPGSRLGLLIEHYTAESLPSTSIVNVSGAGDTFCGALTAGLCQDSKTLSDPTKRAQTINHAQWAARESIQVSDTVSPKITGFN